MKKIIQLLTIASVALVFGTLTSFAQSTRSVKGNIPFDFAVGNKTLQKGSYELVVAKDSSGSALVTVIDSKGNRVESVIGAVKGGGNNEKAELIFGRDGAKRFLTGIVTSNFAISIPAARSESSAPVASSRYEVVDLAVGTN